MRTPLLLLSMLYSGLCFPQTNRMNVGFKGGATFYQPDKLSYQFHHNSGTILEGGIYYQWLGKGVNTIGINYTARATMQSDSIERFHSFIEIEYLKARRFQIVPNKAYFDFAFGLLLRELLNSKIYTLSSEGSIEKSSFRYGTASITFEPKIYIQPSAEIYYFGSMRANKDIVGFGDSQFKTWIGKYTIVNVSFGIGFIL